MMVPEALLRPVSAPGRGTRRRGGRRALLGAIVASLTATALAAIGILLFGRFGDTEGRILSTTALIAAYGLLALPAGFLLDQGRLRLLALGVLALAAAGFCGALAAVWADGGPVELGKAVGTVTIFGLAGTQTAALMAGGHRRDLAAVDRLFMLSVALALAVGAMVTAALWGELDSSAYLRFLGAAAVLDVLVVILQPIVAAGRGRDYRLNVRLEAGDDFATTVQARDFAAAAAKAIRSAERGGRRVVGISADGELEEGS